MLNQNRENSEQYDGNQAYMGLAMMGRSESEGNAESKHM